MGSIELFPRSRTAGGEARAWRAVPIPGSGAIRVREARLEDYAAIRALQRQQAPELAPPSLKQFESRRLAFPEGQMVAVCAGQVVGAASALIVRWDDFATPHTWKSVTGDGYFTTHDPRAATLYGAELIAATSKRGSAIGRALCEARRRLCRRMNLQRIIAIARLPGYRAAQQSASAEVYAMRVIWGEAAEEEMRFAMAQGFQYCGILRGYFPEDAASHGCAALLAWANPFHTPPGPIVASEPQRKCA